MRDGDRALYALVLEEPIRWHHLGRVPEQRRVRRKAVVSVAGAAAVALSIAAASARAQRR